MKKNIVIIIFFSIGILRGQTLTYADDIAPIINAKCAYCHYQGGIAPFALTSYTSVFAHKSSILYDVQNNIMPPWPPDTTYSRFVGERILTLSEKNKIISWIQQGAPSGNLNLAPPTPTFSGGYQLQGTPDLIVKIPPLTSSASTQDQYVCISVATGLSQDRYIKAFEIVPGNKSIVHHVLLGADTSQQMPPGIYPNCTSSGKIGLGGYVPGQGPVVFPSTGQHKMGMLLPKNSKIIFQMHYPAGSFGQWDSTQVRFYFYPVNETNVRVMYVVPLLQNWQLAIQPNTIITYTNKCQPNGQFVNCQFLFPVSVFGTFPHSHLLCKNLVNYAFSGTDTVKLIRINRWDFHWQGFYTFKKMKKVPAGYKWVASHTYDNTSSNPNNPNNPPQLVTSGEATTDEMLFDSFYLTFYQNGDENINIDSLITVSVNEINASRNQTSSVKIYPNPAKELVFIERDLNSDASVFVYDIMGKLKTQILLDRNNTIVPINVTEWENGIYFIQFRTNNQVKTHKFIKE
ncbi:MAG: T9SS type A sorting domain-containing protein [Bacteroidia bacterium]|nr:T9SS type A sorting domain-containing protein [Bacteroidia bacterium]